MDARSNHELTDALINVLSQEERVRFAYLYGSLATEGAGNDIDIAIFASQPADPHGLSADLKHDMSRETGLPPDIFDVRIINSIVEQGDLFSLLYLKNVLEGGRVLVDKDPDLRAAFLERYGLKYRECEGLIQEALR